MEVSSQETKPKQQEGSFTGQKKQKKGTRPHIGDYQAFPRYLDFEVTFSPSGPRLPYSAVTTNQKLSNGSNPEKKQRGPERV